jgi:flagella basal body P-ring formation protein FlgA
MICSASAATIALLLGAPASGADTVPSAAIATRVCGEVAERWHVDTSLVRLQWGLLPAFTSASDAAPLRLVGTGSDGWYLVVVEPVKGAPHAVRVHAGELRTLRIASHALRSGQQLAATDIGTRTEVVWGPPSSDSLAAPIGWEVRRDIVAGTILGPTAIVAPRVIAAGDKVVFAWAKNGVRIEREAVAIGPARLGEIVQARIGTSRLEGRATGHGVAELTEVMR